jgi:hypothetical protein
VSKISVTTLEIRGRQDTLNLNRFLFFMSVQAVALHFDTDQCVWKTDHTGNQGMKESPTVLEAGYSPLLT